MSQALVQRLQSELDQLWLVDPHTHINPLQAPSRTLADILGYHYYTELAHSAGIPREQIEEPGLSPRDKVGRIVPGLAAIENTVQHSWLLEICRDLFGFEHDRIHESNWERLYDQSLAILASPGWEREILQRSRLTGVFLTNDFDDPLAGFDTSFYIPCLRTDDLVFRLSQPETRQRFRQATGGEAWEVDSLREGIRKLFAHFLSHNARACAISLPPDFAPAAVSSSVVEPLLGALRHGRPLSASEQGILSRFVFWSLAEECAEAHLPFDLMIGVNRRVYPAGVYQGQDLFDSRCSLSAYAGLFNAFPRVTFPVSVLAHGVNQELVSYAWIFPNVVTSSHWWYSNIPAYIEPDLRARLQAVPQTKQIGYYSDMYKLEFAKPKFGMFRRVLARVLAEDFVMGRGWSETSAVALGKTILCDNTERIFPRRGPGRGT
ncbi:MAG TPA: amidohydrolase [Planctomycetaceae bacterium]|nr:amidohydrolase [Planctomycetaceae bacterium]